MALMMMINHFGGIILLINRSGKGIFSIATENLYDNKFHHLCLSHDGSKRNMYVDGSLKATDNAIWPGTTNWPTSNASIGMNINNNLALSGFNGAIDDVRIYSSAITLSSIQKLFAEGPQSDIFISKK